MKRVLNVILMMVICMSIVACGNNANKSKKGTTSNVSQETTYIYKDFFGYEYYFKLLPDGSAVYSPTDDPKEIDRLGDIERHQQYMNPERGYYNKGSEGCLYEVIFDDGTYYIAEDGYIYTSFSAMRSKNHNSAFEIVRVK